MLMSAEQQKAVVVEEERRREERNVKTLFLRSDAFSGMNQAEIKALNPNVVSVRHQNKVLALNN